MNDKNAGISIVILSIFLMLIFAYGILKELNQMTIDFMELFGVAIAIVLICSIPIGGICIGVDLIKKGADDNGKND